MIDFEAIESGQRQHFEEIQHSLKLDVLNTGIEYKLFSILRPKICPDGNRWCVLYGENLHDGIAGFGDTPHEAVLDWNKRWHEPIKTSK